MLILIAPTPTTRFLNVRAEGINTGLISINMLSNIDDWHLDNVWIEELTPIPGLDESTIVPFTNYNNQPVTMGKDSEGGIGLTISNFSVGDEHITFENNNWNVNSTGKLNIGSSLWGHWTL
ncbi:glycoside hydrolase family 49 protein [Xylona heveae TC161]|uniref:Glycoside hydrolase family 49 protein n=1 Tax=Xylona heveae (strain CBS 132557 / TC161) TaxID=1328760 RepID=A0A164ZGP1_XYLHT|nr:glycoside hydrolase family 49 protein [Xylona heveae TC161]KZF19084.1 glycoside hydrolase family 49 protein [Xylona heveae TC161]